MLDPLLGLKGSKKVLIFMAAHGEGHAREISISLKWTFQPFKINSTNWNWAEFWQEQPMGEHACIHLTQGMPF